ncbi:unnamed protein product [Closterium sp. Yama58-4]|nr:unnamed protein product [Closterium sp. Yama58-4]
MNDGVPGYPLATSHHRDSSIGIPCDQSYRRGSHHANRSAGLHARISQSCVRMFISARSATVAASGGPSSSRAAHNPRATLRPRHVHPTRFLRTRSARRAPTDSPSFHRLAVSAATGASQASGGSEPSVSAWIREIGEEDSGEKFLGRFLQDDVGPNQVVLEAQARVCTGPTQTRPLGEEEMRRVLEQILLSAKGELPPSERVSRAQMGGFFAGMTVRANCFPPPRSGARGRGARWMTCGPPSDTTSPGTCSSLPTLRAPFSAMLCLWGHLPRAWVGAGGSGGGGPAGHSVRCAPWLPGEISGGISGEISRVWSRVKLRVHLFLILCALPPSPCPSRKTMSLLQNLLPMRGGCAEGVGGVSDALVAAYLIAVRMNRETDRELKAFCLAFDQELGPAPIARVPSLTHYGEPYDGTTRYFRPTLFVAAVRASYGEACLLHGVDAFPPKLGATEEAMLSLLGANTSLSTAQAAAILEDPQVHMAYLSLKDCSPSCYSLVDMRRHIKKRPTFATTEKVQRYIHASGREAMVAGFYHEGYEEPLLMLMRRQPVEAGLVVKGEEGSLALMTRRPAPDAAKKGRPVNYCAGFRPGSSGSGWAERGGRRGAEGGEESESGGEEDGFYRETFSMEADAVAAGMEETLTPRIDRSAQKNLDLGLEALRGIKGPAYDRIVFNAAVQDHLLGWGARAIGLEAAVERAREAVDSGRALKHLVGYVERSKQMR